MELIPPREGQSVFLVNHPSGQFQLESGLGKMWHEQLQGLQCEFGGHPTLFVELPASPRSLDEELKNLGSMRAEVHVSSAVVTQLATESAAWFQGWNGNSPLKVMQGIVQPLAEGGSFHIQQRYVDIQLLVVGLTAWQVWVSNCKEAFSGKRTPAPQSLMMIWFNLISTLRGKFERLHGPLDASEEARAHFLRK